MQSWFTEAKLGVFIHWGIYAVEGVPESWSFYTGQVPYERYMAQLNGFSAANYDPAAWAELFTRAGARYAVLTARHHDGVALWDSACGGLNVGRDLLGPYASALRDRGLKVGFYYSHSDWSHPEYASVRSTGEAQHVNESPYVAPQGRPDDPAAWERYLDYRDCQVGELVARYRPDVLWFDGEWERAEDQWRLDKLAGQILAEKPDTVLNARMLSHGDYATPEQGVPIEPPSGPWELCLTINESWGYQPGDHAYKSVRQLVRYFAETIGMGGNLLLDVGPMADGTIPAEQVERLEGLGAWIRKHAAAVYGTVGGLPAGYHYGPSTLSADRRTLYLMCFGTPGEAVGVKGLRTKVLRAREIGSGEELSHWVTGGLHEVPGITWISAPSIVDPVIALELQGPLDLYRGVGRG